MLAIRFVVFLVWFAKAVFGNSYDWSMGNTTVWLSAGAYCETNTYMTRTYKGPSAGFVPTYVLDDKDTNTQVVLRIFLYYIF